jgi:hypothetical protein
MDPLTRARERITGLGQGVGLQQREIDAAVDFSHNVAYPQGFPAEGTPALGGGARSARADTWFARHYGPKDDLAEAVKWAMEFVRAAAANDTARAQRAVEAHPTFGHDEFR